ncbi:hypothetical protein ACFLIM_41085 [Nonomuraea sp. M3C6]|uniref:PcfJ-like protein n=1 Tax=Nonomuraea marmarensis TaxID=3351344 RepID=A0ABW7AU68_9ACTN
MRLAYGVVTGRDQQVWDARGQLVPGNRRRPAPGAPVVVGPAGADPRPAMAALAKLIAGGSAGVAAAGAGVELCPGFVSARLDGVRGDRRDAVLAAIQVLGLDGLHRLGDRAGVLVALFGTQATKPVAAAASRAIGDGRWAALQLASAASGLLGSEQVERLLHLGTPDPAPQAADATSSGDPAPPSLSQVDPAPWALASVMADHLAQVLGPFPQRRRLGLLLDLWERVAGRQEAVRRRQRLLATQGRQSRLEELTKRYAHHEDEFLLQRVRSDVGHEPSVAEAARWFPKPWHWTLLMNRAMRNAMAATVLLRTAVAVADHGVRGGIERCADQLVAAAALMEPHEAGSAARRVPGLAGLPARPGCYVRDLAARRAAPSEPYVRQRLARAAEYAQVVMDAVTDLILEGDEQLSGWSEGGLPEWRAAVGYTSQRAPADWSQQPVAAQEPPLADRLGAAPEEVEPEEVETVGDLLWYAELADALAQLHGHESATVEYGPAFPAADWDPQEDESLVPRLDSIPSALAGAAQLVSLGSRAPRQCRTWQELATGLAEGLEITQALTSAFRLPEPLAAVDGTLVPGTEARLECARHPRTLAQWSAYMGNCIAGPYYVEQAAKGTCGLAALRDPNGRILANVELRHRRQGWQIVEFRARFNADPDPGLRDRVVRWVATLPPPPPAEPPPSPEPSVRERLPAPRRHTDRTFREVSGPLAELAERALAHPSTVNALRTLESMYHGSGAEVLTALRRLSADRIERACRDALPVTGLAGLWQATQVRPLDHALAGLEPELAARFDHLGLLPADAPLPGSLRKLARHASIAPARSMELVARRIRAALGRLARTADPVLAQQVARHPDTEVLCSLVIAVTSWPAESPGPSGPLTVPVTEPGKVVVPGFPRSDLEDPDGPWQRAMPGAGELGADLDAFWERVATDGLRVPGAWLGNGGWSALWQRAARHARPSRQRARAGATR